METLSKLDSVICVAIVICLSCVVFVGYQQNKLSKSLSELLSEEVKQSCNLEENEEFTSDSFIFESDFETTEQETTFSTDFFETQTVCTDEYTEAPVNNDYTQRIYDIIEYTTVRENNIQTTTEKYTQLDTVLVFSKNSNKLHSRSCPYALKIKEENRVTITIDQLQEYLDNGYVFCSHCQGCV